MVIGDWLNIGGTDDSHNSNIKASIRRAGIFETITERVSEVTHDALGYGTELGVWIPAGIRKDIYGHGKLRFWYENEDRMWDWDFIKACHHVRNEGYGVEVIPYMGGIDLATDEVFHRAGRMLAAAECKKIVIDNLSRAEPGDYERVYQLKHWYGIDQIGSEFPEDRPNMSTFGCAFDQVPKNGKPQGAELAIEKGLIKEGEDQDLHIKLSSKWPSIQDRIDFWKAFSPGVRFYGNMSNEAMRAVVEANL